MVRLRAEFTFYFDFQLPAIGRTFEGSLMCLKEGSYDAYIKPRNPGDPLFPTDVDKTLSATALTIAPLGEAAQIHRAGKDICIDHLQIGIVWESSALDIEAEQKTAIDRAIDAANYYLDHCRYVGRLPHVKRIRRAWRPDDGDFYILNPYTSSWFRDDDDSQFPIHNGLNSCSSLGSIRAPLTGQVDFDELASSMATGTKPPLAESLLVDAEEFLINLGIREAVVTMATAIEASVENFIEHQLRETDESAVKAARQARQDFATKYLSEIPYIIASRRFGQESAADFRNVQLMYQERNRLMHTGSFRHLKGLPEREAQKLAFDWLLSVWRAIHWLKQAESSNED